MRLKYEEKISSEDSKLNFNVISIDDEIGMIKTLQVLLGKDGYAVDGFTDHNEGIEKIKRSSYDLLILDYLLMDAKGDEVVREIRKFNNDLYILLLTGHAENAPPMETLERNNIQGYCEKSNDPSQLLLMVKSAFKSIELMREIKKTKDGLNKILKSVPMIYQLQPINIILSQILNSVLPLVHASDAFILIDDFHEDENFKESFYQGFGQYDTDISNISNIFTPQMMEYAGTARRLMQSSRSDDGIYLPLISENNQTMGILYIKSDDTDLNLDLLEIFATQAASSIKNAFLHSLVNIKNEELVKTYDIIRKRYEETINTLRLTVDARDEYTRGHSDRVAAYAVEIGKLLENISEQELKLLHIGGVFHDIGKIGTSDDILLSDKKLTSEEFEVVKKHPITGSNILSALSIFKEVVPIVKYHHERYDGSGYPSGLKGDKIPLFARIISVADAFDAMTSNRKYRNKLDVDIAVNQLIQGIGVQFDPIVVKTFVSGFKSGKIRFIE